MYYMTYNGYKISPLDITSADVCLDDIAHHLTNINRFGGALPLGTTYNVAQHSIYLADEAFRKTQNRHLAAAALLHDASEAYLGDVVSGLKCLLPDYKAIEERVQNLINKKYLEDVSIIESSYIKELDKRILLDEVLAICPERWEFYYEGQDFTPLGIEEIKINVPSEEIKALFLSKCQEYDIISHGEFIKYVNEAKFNAALRRVQKEHAKAIRALANR